MRARGLTVTGWTGKVGRKDNIATQGGRAILSSPAGGEVR